MKLEGFAGVSGFLLFRFPMLIISQGFKKECFLLPVELKQLCQPFRILSSCHPEQQLRMAEASCGDKGQ